MLQVARLAPSLLGDAATRVETFLQEQFNDDGGARDRDGSSDLYYTVFALDGLTALQAEAPADAIAGFLSSFSAGSELDLVHLACLARCWAALPKGSLPSDKASAMAENMARFRRVDGGFGPEISSEEGTVYHAFLALGAYQDLQASCPHGGAMAQFVSSRRSSDGGYANTAGLPVGSTTVTAAAVTLLRQLDQPVPEDVGRWLLEQAHSQGGFLAAPRTPMPDLLSTATALHALTSMHVDWSHLREPCLDFLDSLWNGQPISIFHSIAMT